MPNVKLHFHHKLCGADYRKRLAWFEMKDKANQSESSSASREIEVTFDFMIGADGAHSAVRYHLMKFTRMSYQQQYIDTLWCEFQIPPLPGGKYGDHDGFALSPNHLHIWPAGSFMFIAIPSFDKSFTCTLFMPEIHFQEIDGGQVQLIRFFQDNFPGVVPNLISEDALVQQYNANPHLPLISIKCAPYHYSASAVILGDAAHAMVPFYGQGMNSGLEDVRVLYDLIDAHAPSSIASDDEVRVARGEALAAYSKQRSEDAHAINDLSLQNYHEMHSAVRSPLYLFRKSVEEKLSVWFPALGIRTQYARVSFGNERYSRVVRAVARQGKFLLGAINVVTLGLTAGIFFAFRRWVLLAGPMKGTIGRDMEWLGAWISSTGDAIKRR